MPALAAFLNDLEHTRLLSAEDMRHYRECTDLEPPVTPEELAAELVRHGKLSRYQADTIVGGKFKGKVLGDFELLAPLGKGGMAYVFLAQERKSNQLMAVKLLSPSRAEEQPHLVDRFHREALIGKRLNHPGITKVLSLRYVRGILCLGMEYVPGVDLYRQVYHHGPMQIGPACRLVADMALAVEHAHRAGIVHADLKPANLMVLPREARAQHQGARCKILDFGLSVDLARAPERASLSIKGNIAGTLTYMAPEQTYPDRLPIPASDLYALGCTLFFALTGKPPFQYDSKISAQEKIHAHRFTPPPKLEQFIDAPAELSALLQNLMAKDPAKRPAKAILVANALRAQSKNLQPTARIPT